MATRKPSPLYKWAVSFGRKTTLHRAIMERHLGYRLPKSVHVHHRNHDKTDNRLENLEVMPARDHGLLHAPRTYPIDKVCLVCGAVFRPHKTKRKRAKTCGHVCARILAAQSRRRFTDGQVAEMRKMRAAGATQWDVARHFGVGQGTIWPYLQTGPSHA